MNKLYYLSSCSTCKRIMDSLHNLDSFEKIDIKEKNISARDLDRLAAYAGSYEEVFSKRALKYRGLGLHEKNLTEKDYRQWILKEYTFLKRPVFFIGDKIFYGNSKSVVKALQDELNG